MTLNVYAHLLLQGFYNVGLLRQGAGRSVSAKRMHGMYLAWGFVACPLPEEVFYVVKNRGNNPYATAIQDHRTTVKVLL